MMRETTTEKKRFGIAAILYGAAHAFDLGGTLVRHRGRFADGFAGDRRAIAGDWSRALSHVTPKR